jgi:hypothetical protein
MSWCNLADRSGAVADLDRLTILPSSNPMPFRTMAHCARFIATFP